MALYFECRARYDKMGENGVVKKVNEPYIVDALTFTEAESRFIEKVSPYISGEFTVSVARKTKISEIFIDIRDHADKWYLVKINWIVIDAKTNKEKKSPCLFLVQACDFEDALDHFKDGMKGVMMDYSIVSIAETKYMDVFPYEYKDGENNPA